jgi:hypothetical protein
MRQYGTASYNLIERKDDVTKLIQDDHADWVINFLFSLMFEQYRFEFFRLQLNTLLKHVKSRNLKKVAKNFLIEYEQGANSTIYRECVNLLDFSKSRLNQQSVDACVCLALLEVANLNKTNPTRAMTDAMIKLAESKCYLDVVKYPYNENLEQMAFELMEYTEIWK